MATNVQMPSTDDVIIRRATAEDHGAIVGNGDVYGGLDYLDAIFARAVLDPDVYPVVAELKGQVVGFMMDHVIDGGMSVIRRAVRTFPPYRNMGIKRKMNKALTSLTDDHFPNLRYRYECNGIKEEKPAAKDLHLEGFVEILRKPIINLVYKVPEITGLDAKDELPAVLALEYDDVQILFTLDDMLEQLFPEKRLFTAFVGYRCMESNIKHLLDDHKEVCVTTRSPSLTPDTTKLSVLKDVDVVTFSERYMAQAGLVYTIDIYAKEGHSEASLQAHIQRHLSVLKEVSPCDRGVMIVSLGRDVCEEKVRDHLGRCGIADRIPNALSGNALFEKKLKSQKLEKT